MRPHQAFVLLASPLCGVAWMLNSCWHHPTKTTTTARRFLFLSHTKNYPNQHKQRRQYDSSLTWLPTASGSPLQDFAGPFSSKDKDTPESKNKINNKINGSNNQTRISANSGYDTFWLQYNDNNSTGNVTKNAASKKEMKYNQKGHEVSPLFGQDQHHTKSLRNSSKNNEMTDANQTSNKSYYSSLVETYFPFLQSTTPTNTPLRFPSSTETISRSKVFKKSNLNDTIASILKDKSANDTVTVSDLKMVLSYIESLKFQQGGLSSTQNSNSGITIVPTSPATQSTSSVSGKKRSSTQVAFPQPSVLSYRDVQRGTTLAGGVLGMMVGTTILPNLWLLGILLGAMYGFEITKPPLDGQTIEEQSQPNIVGKYLIQIGRFIAVNFLKFYDYWKTLWFLYKTGQLSYEYYKRYEMLDKRFEIQNKVDAWNARFVEGKQRFDQWEQENEIGRTVLAGLRTVWLVDEQSKRRTREKSRYRVVQLLYDTKFYVKKWLKKARYWAKSFFQEGGITNLIGELKADLASGGSMGARFAAVLVAVAVVNIGGALFSISPGFSNFLAVLLAALWPSWALNMLLRIRNQGAEIKSRAGGSDVASASLPTSFNAPDFMRRYDQNAFHFYTRLDGTKRYYRTGQSIFTNKPKTKQGAKIEQRPKSLFDRFFQQPPKTTRTKPGDGWLGKLRNTAR